MIKLEAILEEQREVGRNTLKEVYAQKGSNFGISERVLRINNLGSEDIKKDLEKKDIIIGVPSFESITLYNEIKMNKIEQKNIIRISLSDDISQLEINTFVTELQKII